MEQKRLRFGRRNLFLLKFQIVFRSYSFVFFKCFNKITQVIKTRRVRYFRDRMIGCE